MATEAARLEVTIRTNADKATKELKGLDTQTKKTGDGFKGFAKSFVGKLGITAAISAATAAIIKFGIESANAARDAEETSSKFNTVFRDIAGEANRAAEDIAESFGLADSTVQKLVGNTGDLLTGFGLTQDAALELSDATTRLAIDLASFTNAQGGAEAVSRALTSAYSGEREALKTYGIVISEAAVEAEVLRQTQEGLVFATEQQARAAATLTLATEQSQNAIGDYERTSDSAANVQRGLQQEVLRLKENFGELVLEALTPVQAGLRAYIKGINDARDATNNVEDAVAGLQDGTVDYEAALTNIRTGLTILASQIREAYATGNERLAQALVERQRELNAELVQAERGYSRYVQGQAEAARVQQELADSTEDLTEEVEINKLAIEQAAKQNFDAIQESKLAELELTERINDKIAESEADLQRVRDENARRQEENARATKDGAIDLFNALGGLADEAIKDEKARFIAQKAFSIGNAIINTAEGITKALASTNIPLAGLIGATGAIQIATIAAQQAPSAQFGGSFVVPPGSPGDSAMLQVNQGERVDVSPVRESSGGSGMTNINLMLDGRVLAKATVDGINSGQGGKIDARLVRA